VEAEAAVEDPAAEVVRGGEAGAMEREDIILASGFAMMPNDGGEGSAVKRVVGSMPICEREGNTQKLV